MKHKIKSAFILGSTSLVAKEICIELAKNGCKSFSLVARNQEKNNNLYKEFKNFFNLDIQMHHFELSNQSNLEQMKNILSKRYDLYIITAGYLGNSSEASFNFDEAEKIININYKALLPWLIKICDKENLKSNSKLWVFSSVAGDRGRPSNYHYGASKSALNTFCEGLILKTHNKPFSIRLIKAGIIDTPMSKGIGPNLLKVSPKYIAKVLLKNPNKKGIEYLPWWWSLIMMIIKSLPKFLISKL